MVCSVSKSKTKSAGTVLRLSEEGEGEVVGLHHQHWHSVDLA